MKDTPSTPARLAAAIDGRYGIERELGQGGMATVYLAEDLKHKRKVALKVLRTELAAVLGAERFVQEITTTASLQHPHILPLFDSGEADGFLYYVMPYVEGETLRDKLNRETQLGIDEAVRITTEVADALHYAHRHGVIHRDIKPENILLHDGRPMVADFGIALAVSAAAGGRMTETGLSLGTPHYMSPEQATAEKDLTNRSDIYSLGAVLHEMLTGHPPHTGASAQQIIMKIVTEEPAPVTSVRKSVPPNVTAAVAKALEKLPADRFENAKSFAEALANPTFTTSTASAHQRTAVPLSRPTSVRLLAAIAIVTGALAVWGWLRSPTSSLPTERQWIGLHARNAGGVLPSWWVEGLAIAPDGSAIVFADSGDSWLPLQIKERESAGSQPIPGAVGGSPFFSPNGQWIGFANNSGLYKIPRGGGVAVRLSDSTSAYPEVYASGAWLDDGTIVFVARDNVHLFQVDDDGASQRQVLEAGRIPGGITHLAPLPEGQGVLIAVCPSPACRPGEVWALDLQRDTVVKLLEGARSAWFMRTGHLLYGRRDGNLFAQRLDRQRLALTGSAIAIFGPTATYFGTPAVVFSAGGSVLYAEGGEVTGVGSRAELVWIDRDGRDTVLSADMRSPGIIDVGLSLSPDGSKLALTQRTDQGPQVFVKQMPDGPVSRLTFEGGSRRPAWEPDGRDVLFVGDREGRSVALRRRADGTGAETVVAVEARPIWEVLVSPDAEWLLYRTDNLAAGRGDIMARRLSGDTTVRALIATPAAEVSPTISPDGRWLAYTSDEGGRAEIFVRPFPNVDDGKWQVSRSGGTEPLWSPDGRELFYRSSEGPLVAAQVVTTTSFRVTSRRRLFSMTRSVRVENHTAYTVSRDGRRFLFTRIPQGQDAFRLVLVQNWFTELRPLLERE